MMDVVGDNTNNGVEKETAESTEKKDLCSLCKPRCPLQLN